MPRGKLIDRGDSDDRTSKRWTRLLPIGFALLVIGVVTSLVVSMITAPPQNAAAPAAPVSDQSLTAPQAPKQQAPAPNAQPQPQPAPAAKDAAATAPSTERATPSSTSGPTVQVRPGDTLWSLANQFHTTVAALQSLNGLGTSTLIRSGQHLLVPTTAATSPAQPGKDSMPPASDTPGSGKDSAAAASSTAQTPAGKDNATTKKKAGKDKAAKDKPCATTQHKNKPVVNKPNKPAPAATPKGNTTASKTPKTKAPASKTPNARDGKPDRGHKHKTGCPGQIATTPPQPNPSPATGGTSASRPGCGQGSQTTGGSGKQPQSAATWCR